MKEHYEWPGIKWESEQFIQYCSVCAQAKHHSGLIPSTPHPLPIPSVPWQDVTMNLVTDLSSIKGINAVCTVVDHFSKEAVFISMTNGVTLQVLTLLFYDHIWSKYGALSSVFGDQGPQFIVKFNWDLNQLLGITTWLSMTNHPQSDR